MKNSISVISILFAIVVCYLLVSIDTRLVSIDKSLNSIERQNIFADYVCGIKDGKGGNHGK